VRQFRGSLSGVGVSLECYVPWLSDQRSWLDQESPQLSPDIEFTRTRVVKTYGQ
jgi:hypothetical protein